MTTQSIDCPTDERLAALLASTDAPDVTLEHHLESCAGCRQRLEQLASKEGWERLVDPVDSHKASAGADTEATAGVVTSRLDRSSERATSAPPQIDGYSIEEQIGAGGMGVVYRAQQHRLNRAVAIKVLPAECLNPERRLRFRTEAEATGRLRHDHIVQVFESRDTGGVAYVAQELLEGGSLADRMTGGPVAADEAAAIISATAAALVHAHDQNVLHRDIKPGNILFADQTAASVKLADFGLAKLLDDEDGVTVTQGVIGTPAYMSPEQATGGIGAIGPVSDLFSLGIVFYELLTGVAPFRADTPVESLRLIQEHDPVGPRRLQPAIPRDLETICLKCLEKHPADRYGSAAALLEDLTRYQSGRPILAKPPGVTARVVKFARRHPASASLTLCLVFTLVALLLVWARFTARLQTQTQIANDKTKAAVDALAAQTDARIAAQEVLSFMTDELFESALVKNAGVDARVLDVLANADAGLDTRFEERPAVEATVRETVGSLYWELGQPLRALPHIERAVQIYDEFEASPNSAQQINALHRADLDYLHARCLNDCDRPDEASVILDRLLAREDVQGRPELYFSLQHTRAGSLMRERTPDEMEPLLTSLRSDCEAALGRKHKLPMQILSLIAVNATRMGDAERAQALHREEIELAKEILGPDHPDTLAAMNNLAVRLTQAGQFDEARELYEHCLETKLRVIGPDHLSTIGQHHNLSMLLWRMGEHSEATRLLDRAIEGRARVLGSNDRRTLESLYQIGRMYLQMEEYAAGEQLFDRRVGPELAEAAPNGQWLSLLSVYARFKAHQGDTRRATELVTKAREMLESDESIGNPSRIDYLDETEKLVEGKE